jgi:integrase
MEKELVRLRIRPSRNGRSFSYFLDYVDPNGKRQRKSPGHRDEKKAKAEKAKLEKQLNMGVVAPESMRLSEFVAQSLKKTGDQIRESTREGYEATIKNFIKVIGDKDFQRVTLADGEFYRQYCLDDGNAPTTVTKKLKEITAMFQLAVKRRQLETNPLAYIAKPKCPEPEIHTYTDDECRRMVKAAKEFVEKANMTINAQWDLLILVALCTGLRRGELCNCLWSDIDLGEQTITISPKADTEKTWKWLIKDSDFRKVPLTEELVQMLIEHQSRQPEGYPYVFIPPARYDYIQQLRAEGKWKYRDSGIKTVARFNKVFLATLKRARIAQGTFHDLRRTAICYWFREGLSELEVKTLAGHANFETTHKYYLKVDREKSVRRAREASAQVMSRSGTLWRAPLSPCEVPEGPVAASAGNSCVYEGGQGQVDVTG